MKLVISNGHIVSPTDERICDLEIEDGLITAVGNSRVMNQVANAAGVEVIDANNCWVTPGLVDLQVNGGDSCNFWADPDITQVTTFMTQLAQAGVTCILPTLITDDVQHLRKNIDFLEQQAAIGIEQLTAQGGITAGNGRSMTTGEQRLPVRLPGIHLEGPCLSPQRPGVHPPAHLRPLSVAVLEQIVTGSVKLMTLAPELDPTGDAVAWLHKRGVRVALGHSNASYDEASKAFGNGIALVTHTFNAMPPIHHRAPGAVTAALLDDTVSCCIICDGLHLAPQIAKLVVRTKGHNKSILVTDIAHVGTSRGGLVGSSIMLCDAVRNIVSWGIASFQQAITMATFNPAKAMGWDGAIGHLAVGKQADIVIWQKETLSIKRVISHGELLN